MTAVRREIGDLLVDNGVITQEDLDLVKEEHVKTGDSVVDILSKKGLANENQLKNALELEYGVNFVDLLKTKTRPDDDAVRLLPEDFMRSHRVVGVSVRSQKLTLAMVDPSDSHASSAVKEKLPDLQVKTVVCVEDALVTFLNDFFGTTHAAKETNGDGHISNHGSEESAVSVNLENPTVAADVGDATAEAAAFADTLDKESSGQAEPAEPIAAPDELALAANSPGDNEPEASEAKEAEPVVREADTPAKEVESERSKTEAEVEEEPPTSPAAGVAPSKTTEPQASGSVEDAAEKAAHLQGAGAGSRSKTPTHTRLQAQTSPEANEQVEKAEEEAVVLLANQILGGAIKRGATHIHIIPAEREAVVNYRVGGSLIVDRKLPKTIVASVINRYKIMAKLNVNEKSCLDGHIKVKSSSKEIVCLVSIIPTVYGEHAVVWIV
jgi:type II secretory ATPase GspE/PulE/Tfp pilus assembly ATPase PilB-like protein